MPGTHIEIPQHRRADDRTVAARKAQLRATFMVTHGTLCPACGGPVEVTDEVAKSSAQIAQEVLIALSAAGKTGLEVAIALEKIPHDFGIPEHVVRSQCKNPKCGAVHAMTYGAHVYLKD